jgi:hypothetical protein
LKHLELEEILSGNRISNVTIFLSWRELLGNLIQDPQERQRIVNAIGVNAITLTRWANNTSNPRPQHLRHLLASLPPEVRSSMFDAILKEYPDFTATFGAGSQVEPQESIPSTFYSRIFSAYAMTPRTQRSWSITNLVLQQALGQLDPNRVGMAITVVQCMPSSLDGKVCSLRERTGYGTPPWNLNLEPYAVFLGAESLAGYVVSSCHPRFIQNSEEHQGVVPAHWVEWERSAAAYPIFRSGKVAGCLVVSCTEPHYFLSHRQKLIQHYADLLVLAFEANEFYDLQLINLHVMPYYRVQAEYLANFRQRVASLMTECIREGKPIDLKEAEATIWRQVEAELLRMPPYTGMENTDDPGSHS